MLEHFGISQAGDGEDMSRLGAQPGQGSATNNERFYEFRRIDWEQRDHGLVSGLRSLGVLDSIHESPTQQSLPPPFDTTRGTPRPRRICHRHVTNRLLPNRRLITS